MGSKCENESHKQFKNPLEYAGAEPCELNSRIMLQLWMKCEHEVTVDSNISILSVAILDLALQVTFTCTPSVSF